MHYFKSRSFTKEQEAKLKDIASPSYQIENFLTDNEFKILRQIFQKKIKWNEEGEISKYHGFGWDTEYGPMLKWLKIKIDQMLPNWQLDFLALQEAIIPWKIHADIRWYSNQIPYKMMLIPVDVDPIAGPVSPGEWPETSTITFKQKNFLSRYKANSTDGDFGNKNPDKWLRPIDDPCVENLINGYNITQEQWQKYFTHIPYDYFEGLEIESIFNWKPKSIIVWDNSALHCSDDFLSNGIKTKKSLMICSVLKE
jgi:hypothetical protein